MNNLMETYSRLPVRLVRGSGCFVWDDRGKEYLDMVAGIAVCNLGHAHPEVVKALQEQAGQLFHCSNLYHIPQQEKLADLIVCSSFKSKVFFCNSGAEANEGAIKLARKYCNLNGKRGSRIITVKGSFHGRTLATVAATGQDKFRQGFDPIPDGFVVVEYGDIQALEKALNPEIGAVMLEPIQGEGGIKVPPPGYLRQVREFCDREGLLLMLDEVQTGLGRTGELFGYMHEKIEPDIMTLAKALGNGFPVGALVARPEVASAFQPGSHASTFGGNPLAMSCGLATLKYMIREKVAENSLRQGLYLRNRLTELKSQHPCIRDVRGKGLMVGVESDADLSFMVAAGLEKGLLLNIIKGNIIRLVPPLIITMNEIDRAVETIDSMLRENGL